MNDRGHIAYVLNAFPVVSETFILNEIRAVEAESVPLVILPLTRRIDRIVHSAVAGLRSPCRHPPGSGLGSLRLVAAHVAVASRHPIRYSRLGFRDLIAPVLRRPGLSGGEIGTRLRRRARLFALAGWIAHAARRSGAVHLHAHYARDPLEVAERVHRLTGLPYSFAAHAKDLYTVPPSRLARRLRSARFAVACHAGGADHLATVAGGGAVENAPGTGARKHQTRGAGSPWDSGSADSPVLLVPHGIDTDLFHPSDDGEPEPGLILAVGRLTPKKGFVDLVSACGRLKAAGREFRCVILGEGRDEGRLREAIRVEGVTDRVEIHAFIPHEELPSLYSRAALFVMPTRVMPDGNRDGIPNVVLEAMACGTPVVASGAGGLREIIEDGRTGRIVPEGDTGALARALAELLDDPCEAARIGRAAADAMRDRHYLRMAAPLVERFRQAVIVPVSGHVEAVVERVSEAAWKSGGLASRAKRVLGVAPRRDPEAEAAIRRCLIPGLRANRWRPDLDRLAARRLWDELYKARRVESLGVSGRILDLGCGRGGSAVALRARGHDVVAFDMRERNCLTAKLRAGRYGLRLPAASGRAEALPFAEGSFDTVLCLEILEHVQDPAGLLREVHRVLRRGGCCFVTVVNRWAHSDPHYHLWGVNFLPRSWANRYIEWRGRTKRSTADVQRLDEMHYYTYRAFLDLANRLGFRAEDLEDLGGFPRGIFRRLARRASLGFNTAAFRLVARGTGA